ncbi:MAG: leucine-rich repeat domain-containing protein [Promethearchaeota archaeon]
MDTFPQKILENYHRKLVNKDNALEKILSIIENSESVEDRIESMDILKKLRPEDELVYKILESSILSDSNELVRVHATDAIRELFLERAFPLMKWAYEHETSLSCLIRIVETLGAMQNAFSRAFLKNRLENIPNPRFKKEIQQIFENHEEIQDAHLSQILINYLIIDFLEKKFNRIDYALQDGLITELDLSYIGSQVFSTAILKKLPEVINHLHELKKLDLKINRLSKLSPSISSLTSLNYMDLSYNKLKSLPESIGNLSLNTLYLRYNQLEHLPSSIGNLMSLKILDLRSNNLKYLPETLGNLKELEILDVHGNQLEELPDNLGNLISLQSLELGLNHLTDLPRSVKNLSRLKKLVLGGNQHIKISCLEHFQHFQALQELQLYDSNLDNLNPSISKLTSLEILNLRNNRLEIIPKELKTLKNLKSLNLSWNHIMEVPEWILELKSLEEFILWGNHLEEFPKIVLELPSLKLIDLNFNRISAINSKIIDILDKKGVKLLR